MLNDKKIAIIGAGKLGEAIFGGLFDAGAVAPANVIATAAHQERLDVLRERFGLETTLANADAVSAADVVLLCTKPQTIPIVVDEIAEVLDPSKLVITAAASVSTGFIEERLGKPIPVLRAMPNTPSLIKRGMTGVAAGAHAGPEHIATTKAIFEAVGRVVVVDEKHMDAITGLSASGPAYLYIIIESLAEAGVKVGLPRHVATELAAQTCLGAGAMVLETGEHPAQLKDTVTTPAGCTIDGILELEDGGLRVTLIKAVVKAAARAHELLEA